MPAPPGAHRPRDLPPRAPPPPVAPLPAGGAVGGDRRAHAGRLRGAPRPRHRDLPRHRARSRRARPRSRWPSSSTRAATGSTCRSTASTSSSATARPATTATAPPPRLHQLGGTRWKRVREQDPRRRSRQMAAELLDLYARRKVAAGYAVPARHPLAARARVELPLRGHARPAQGHRGREARHGAARARWTACSWATWATARPRSRCAPRSRRCRAASRWRCWCPPPFWPSSTRRTFAERLADFPVQGRGAVPLPHRRRSRRRRSGGSAAGEIDIVIGTHRLLSPDVTLQGPRPARRGRGAPLRREAQGAAQAAPARGRRADAHGDADPAHAAPLARRAARHDADRDAAARPLADPHLRRAVGRRAARGGDRARARPRRPGVLRPQPDRDDRDHRGAGAAHSRRARGWRWPTARCTARRARGGDAAVRDGRGGHPRLAR